MRGPDGVIDRIRAVFAAAGATASLHARCLDDGREIGWRADEPAVLLSVMKVPLVLEFARQVAAGQLDPADRVRVAEHDRLGGLGVSGCLDDVEASLRDLAFLAMSISDDTAADLLLDRVGLDTVRALLSELARRPTAARPATRRPAAATRRAVPCAPRRQASPRSRFLSLEHLATFTP